MKIAMLSEGGNVHTRRWVEYFHAAGDEVLLLTLEPTPSLPVRVERIGRRGKLDFLSYTLSLPRAGKILSDFSPDLVNAHFVPNYGWIAALLGRRPLVVSTWGSDVLSNPRRSVLHRWRAQFVLRKADLLTSDAEMMSEVIRDMIGSASPILTVPMGVDRHFHESANPGEAREKIVLQYRNFEPVYDPKTLIAAIPAFLDDHPDWRFRLAGEGSMRAEMEALAGKLGIAGSVSFLGKLRREELISELRKARIYLSASLSDSSSVSLLEAMSQGAYPVVSDIPANREWLGDGTRALFFPCADSRTLSRRLSEAAALPEDVRLPLLEQNRKLIGETAIWEDNMDRVRKAFLELKESA
ncbi:MAG: glycosyltransferase family 4 protein [Candidatus Krumholzibacteria bacterium]|jgi:glycosyltransferase involved in cell wall biosynthesis|nr:glycosyltransferase family 4 protein [Candidatus Krumholzibacteria bacterium]MDP6669867.1 glycosyltransferase family 4 protein [Candidatus Krumholzibacteria bacterium]MDP6798085.1 glycosyltransferase family 4 protein [Candidatus Krumholzibacteria bacterium]MDP7021631.1 glycosyltransferase family 4 protein [Candidatus Krumholzibacteria bacterium]